MWLCGMMLLLGVAGRAATDTTPSGNTPPASNNNSNYVLDDKHILSPGDRVSFRILEDRMFGDGDHSTNLVVADSRELEFPMIGRISVTNKTCKQLVAEITPLYEKEYYVRATVVLGVDMVNKIRGRVYVAGAVKTQGPVDLMFDEPLTVGRAILKAGGFGDFADQKRVKVIRTHQGGKKETFEVNMVDVLEKGKSDLDIVLEPDDYIQVGQRGVNF